jgi:hypothetical protein
MVELYQTRCGGSGLAGGVMDSDGLGYNLLALCTW